MLDSQIIHVMPPDRVELKARIERLQGLMRDYGIDLSLIRQNADLYYFTGTVQDAHLLIPADGPPLFLVWRVYERARKESPLENIEYLPGLKRLPDILHTFGLKDISCLGLEMDILPASLFLYYTKEVWPDVPVKDITHQVRLTRCKKSAWELSNIEAACRQVSSVIEDIPQILKPGINELELAAKIEARLRRLGHPGYLRMRGWNQELGVGQIISGPQGAMPAWTNTPAGGRGVNSAYGQGATDRIIGPGEPVSIDLGGSVNGYVCDQTRPFCIGQPPEKLQRAFELIVSLLGELEGSLAPGIRSSDLYDLALDFMKDTEFEDGFMGQGRNRVRFIGHGLGIEIDEYPFISKGNPMILEEGMTLAIEPKIALNGTGLIGLEDTYLITSQGARRLTLGPQRLTLL